MKKAAAFAKGEFALNTKQEDGSTLRAHLLSAWRQSGVRPEAWPTAKLPPEAAHVWAYFGELNKGRRSNGFGPEPIGWTELDAWARRRRIVLDPWELDAILAIDDAYMVASAKKAPKNDG